MHKDEQNAFKSLEKDVILSWKSLENHSQISVRTLQHVPRVTMTFPLVSL